MREQNYEPVPFVDTSRLTKSEWWDYWKHGVFAFDVPVIYEKTEYSSILGLFRDKVARRPKEELDKEVAERLKKGPPEKEPSGLEIELFGKIREPVIHPDTEYNLPSAVGRALSPVMAEYLSCRLGVPIYKIDAIFQHPHFPFLMTEPNYIAAFLDDNGEFKNFVNVRCKTATHWKLKDIEAEIPLADELACRHDMAVLNLWETLLIYLCDNNEGGVVSYRISRDEIAEADMITKIKGFWCGNVLEEVVPMPTVPTDSAERDIYYYAQSRRQYKRPPEILEKGMPEVIQLYARWKSVVDERKQSFDEAKETLRSIELQLAPFMIGKAAATCGDVKMKWKQTKSRPVDLDGLKMAYPDIYARFVTEKVTPGFEVKLKKQAADDKQGKEAA